MALERSLITPVTSDLYSVFEIVNSLHTYILPWMQSFDHIEMMCLEFTIGKKSTFMCFTKSEETGCPVAAIHNDSGPHYFSEQEVLEVCAATLSERHGAEQLMRATELLLQGAGGAWTTIRQTFLMHPSSVKWNPSL